LRVALRSWILSNRSCRLAPAGVKSSSGSVAGFGTTRSAAMAWRTLLRRTAIRSLIDIRRLAACCRREILSSRRAAPTTGATSITNVGAITQSICHGLRIQIQYCQSQSGRGRTGTFIRETASFRSFPRTPNTPPPLGPGPPDFAGVIASLYPVATASARIRRTMLPKRHRLRWFSASSSQRYRACLIRRQPVFSYPLRHPDRERCERSVYN
jgi:hypothetical protein